MACPSFGSSSEVSLWYAEDPDPTTALPDGSVVGSPFTWYNIPITGEDLNATLSSTISEQITPQRSYANSKLSQGEVGGSFNYEAQASSFMYNMIVCALQADQALDFGASAAAGTSGVVINAVGTGVDDDRTINLTGLTATEGATYSVIIDGEHFNYVAGTTPSTTTIATGLAALIDASTSYVSTSATATITISSGAGLSVITFTSFIPTAWAPAEKLVNGSSKKCLAFLKRIRIDDTHYDYYVFRGCQVSSVSFECSPGALITGTCNLMGVRPETPQENVTQPTYWTFTAAESRPLMSGVDSLENFEIQTAAGVDTGVTVQDVSFTFDNQLRQQQAVGLGHPFAAGIASGRFMATASATAYYANPRIYNAFVNDDSLKLLAVFKDDDGDGFQMNMDFVKVTSGALPTAGGPDQDLTISTEFRAFESTTNGTVAITRLAT